jgi:hypothetical protein
MFKYAHLFFHCDLHSFKMFYNKWCSLHYVYNMWKETIEKINASYIYIYSIFNYLID